MKIKILLILLIDITFCNAQIVNIPDANFKAKLLEASTTNDIAKNFDGAYFKIDANNNNEIEYSEAEAVYELNISNVGSDESIKISDITGLTNFSNLKSLYCYDNLLTSLDLNPFINLINIGCALNQLTSLNISGLNQLKFLSCDMNQISTLDLSNKPNLATLYCEENNISNLNLSGLINLIYLTASNNPLSTLDVSGIENIESLQCMFTNITTLDVSNQTNLDTFLCGNNTSLEEIFMKNGKIESGLNLENLPNLKYVCVDDAQLTTIQNHINLNGSTNCSVNSYCSFNPGGTYYTIQGQNKFDGNNNGCDINDTIFSNLELNITDGITTGRIISSQTGNYAITLSSGNYTITPVLENPTYYVVSPSNVTVSLPSDTNPLTQNFCIGPNGIHKDVEIILLPLTEARPGFDSSYKIVFKNKGNQIENGVINVTYNDDLLDVISANPPFSDNISGNLTWNYTNLYPLESREIDLAFNVNSPIETPPVNNGDQLEYLASITPLSDDEFQQDNTSELKQIVVGSFDPNDKTCIEGNVVSSEIIGQYVHYIIRFENTGTYPAENIVVKDIIETSKFDINTLIPIRGSHNFETRISNTNKVEFIFENIDLPFEDANNDGYVAFKIKTKPNLVIGDTFSNSANIYFDYNYPVLTNNYITVVQNNLAIPENDINNKISMYPNPVNHFLYINTEKSILKIEIFDIAGRIISSNSITENKIDLSELKAGNYILKIYTETGITNSKIVKE